jgi:hypothetical protein
MNEDEWGYVPGSWNRFENSHGWQVELNTARLPTRMTLKEKKEYAAALLWALNHGMPAQDDPINVSPSDG